LVAAYVRPAFDIIELVWETLNALLGRWRNGDRDAGKRVMTLAYSELRHVAGYYLRHEAPGHVLQPTALVNGMFLKLSSQEPVQWKNREHFFAVAALLMRRILIDDARHRRAKKRNDTQIPVYFSRRSDLAPHFENVLAVDEALTALEELDSRAARVVELRVFGGLKEAEIAQALEISPATVKRDWTFARAWLVSPTVAITPFDIAPVVKHRSVLLLIKPVKTKKFPEFLSVRRSFNRRSYGHTTTESMIRTRWVNPGRLIVTD